MPYGIMVYKHVEFLVFPRGFRKLSPSAINNYKHINTYISFVYQVGICMNQ